MSEKVGLGKWAELAKCGLILVAMVVLYVFGEEFEDT